MKRYLLGTSLLALMLATPALASDLNSYKDPTPTPAYEAPVSYSWGGFYIGVIGGYSSGDYDVSRDATYEGGTYTPATGTDAEVFGDTLASYGLTGANSFTLDNGFVGGEISYKANMNGFILEPFVSATIGGDKFSRSWDNDDKATLDTEDDNLKGPYDYNETGSFSFEKKWDTTAGLKAGGLITPRVYAYGLIGATLGSFDAKYANRITYEEGSEAVPSVSYNDTERLWGVTFGGGLEYAITERVHFGLEGRYTLYEDMDIKLSDMKTYNDNSWRSTNDKLSISPDGEWSVLARLSFKLN